MNSRHIFGLIPTPQNILMLCWVSSGHLGRARKKYGYIVDEVSTYLDVQIKNTHVTLIQNLQGTKYLARGGLL